MTYPDSRQADDGRIRSRMRTALREAMAARDAASVSVLRSALSALDNAEAVEAPSAPAASARSPRIAGAVCGVGAAETARRILTAAETEQILRAEIIDREAAALDYEAGHPEMAARLRHEAEILAHVLADHQ